MYLPGKQIDHENRISFQPFIFYGVDYFPYPARHNFLFTKEKRSPDEEGNYTIDFNRAYNPPCAFTPFATCPLPPKENILPIRITAGEKNVEGFGEHH